MSKQLPAEWQQKIQNDAEQFARKSDWPTDYSIYRPLRDGYEYAANEYVLQLVEAQERIKTLEDALKNIIYPIKYLQDKANLEGAQIDGIYAMQLSKDVEFLKGIAKDALSPNNK